MQSNAQVYYTVPIAIGWVGLDWVGLCLPLAMEPDRKAKRGTDGEGTKELEETKNRRVSTKTKQTPWRLIHKRNLPTERPPLVDEI
jgi:hypothetical protein